MMGLSDFITRWSIRGIARTQFRRFKLTQKKNPWISEQEIAQSIFTGRMSRISTSPEQQGRVEVYFDVNTPIQTLREACHAIAVVEFKIHPSDNDNVNFLVGIIDKELDKLGYVEEELKW
jgi:hypothetical protein